MCFRPHKVYIFLIIITRLSDPIKYIYSCSVSESMLQAEGSVFRADASICGELFNSHKVQRSEGDVYDPIKYVHFDQHADPIKYIYS